MESEGTRSRVLPFHSTNSSFDFARILIDYLRKYKPHALILWKQKNEGEKRTDCPWNTSVQWDGKIALSNYPRCVQCLKIASNYLVLIETYAVSINSKFRNNISKVKVLMKWWSDIFDQISEMTYLMNRLPISLENEKFPTDDLIQYQ